MKLFIPEFYQLAWAQSDRLLAGGLGVIISIFMLKPAYGMGASNDSEALLPNYEAMKEAEQDLSEFDAPPYWKN